MPLDIFGQFGFTALIGLSEKNSILIIERPDQLLDGGEDLKSASTLAEKERLQPIIMTSIASLAGFLPLVIAKVAGAIFKFNWQSNFVKSITINNSNPICCPYFFYRY